MAHIKTINNNYIYSKILIICQYSSPVSTIAYTCPESQLMFISLWPSCAFFNPLSFCLLVDFRIFAPSTKQSLMMIVSPPCPRGTHAVVHLETSQSNETTLLILHTVRPFSNPPTKLCRYALCYLICRTRFFSLVFSMNVLLV